MDKLQKLYRLFQEEEKILRQLGELTLSMIEKEKEKNPVVESKDEYDGKTIQFYTRDVILDLFEIFVSDVKIGIKIKDMKNFCEEFRNRMSSSILKKENEERNNYFLESSIDYVKVFWELLGILGKKYSLKVKEEQLSELFKEFITKKNFKIF